MISTGAELRASGQAARVDQIFDANRPMLCAVLRRWGMEVVDIGIVPDEAAAVRAALDQAAERADVIVTSGGRQRWEMRITCRRCCAPAAAWRYGGLP